MAKVTFVFDEETTRILRATAARLGKSQSLVVREAVAEYAAHSGRLSDSERRRMLGAIDGLTRRGPARNRAAVEAEIREVRRSRRAAGRARRSE